MSTVKQNRWCDYGFIISTLWLGFVLAISGLETPLRFRPESITLPLALEIGRLVFHGLNYTEIGLAAFLLVMQCCSSPGRKAKLAYRFVVIVLVVQTLMLFLVLDQRTAAIIAGQDVPASQLHTVYIGMEIVKVVALIFLICYQLGDFKKAD